MSAYAGCARRRSEGAGAGVPLRIAQAAMCHSDPSVTANLYTDPKVLDVARAFEALPRLRGQSRVNALPDSVSISG